MKEMKLSKLQKEALELAKQSGCLQRASKHWWYPSIEEANNVKEKNMKLIAQWYKNNPDHREGFGINPDPIQDLYNKRWEWENVHCVGTQTVLSLVRRGFFKWVGPEWVKNTDFWYQVKLLHPK